MYPVVEKSVTDPAVEKWASFMPALLVMLAHTKGPVLEVGVGHYSTPVLHAICKAECRPLTSLEDNMDWAKRFFDLSDGPEGPHRIAVGNYDDMITDVARSKWSLAFLDHSPGPRRAQDMSLLSESVDNFIVHDYEGAILQEFLNRDWPDWNFVVLNSRQPTTLVASRTLAPMGLTHL